MIWRVLYYGLCIGVVAGMVHVAVVLMVPVFGTRDAYAVVSRAIEPFVFSQVTGAGQETLLSDTDPFFSYGTCRFDLSRTGMYMSGPKIDSFWSATILDDDGSVIYSLNSRTAIDNKLDIILLDPPGIIQLRDTQPPEAESAIIVETDVTSGFVVLRVLRPDDSWNEKADAFLKSIACKPYSQSAPANK